MVRLLAISIALIAAGAIVFAEWRLPADANQRSGSVRYAREAVQANPPEAELARAPTQELEPLNVNETELEAAPSVSPPERVKTALGSREPPLLYIHVRNEAQRDRAEKWVKPLRAKGIEVSGIKRVETADLRYFRSGELEEAWQVARALQELKVSVAKIKRIDGYEDTATPRQYELWLAPERKRTPAG